MIAMVAVLVLCFSVTTAIALSAPFLVDRGRPNVVVPLLAAGSIVCALCSGLVLSLIAASAVGRIPVLAEWGGWSAEVLAETLPVPWPIGATAGVIVVILLARSFWRAGQILHLLVQSDRLSRQLRGSGPPIVMVDDISADAVTVAGLKGCVVISRQLFAALGADERRMVTAHELSHLRRRHHLYVHAVDLAVAANPTLRRAAEPVRLGIERWADEDAARSSGDRVAAATALAGTALTRSSIRRHAGITDSLRTPGVILGVTESHVTERARALLHPPRRQPWVAVAVIVLLLITSSAAVASTDYVHQGFDDAELHLQGSCS
jgi:beta-lactamase regulating signal transducer with metallopeptidase domain